MTTTDTAPPFQSRSPGQSLAALGLSLLLCLTAGGIGAWATNSEIPTWYAGIAKPSWNPPNWIFGPVWTTLYVLMAVAAWLIWRRDGFSRGRWPLTLFAIQLGLNTLWSFLFFGMHNPGLAAVEIVLLWLAILATTISFWRRSPVAGALLVPYLAWVGFATVLNVTIWRMNS